MIIYLADRGMNILGMASTKLPDGFLLTDDKATEDVETGVAVFEFEIHYGDGNRAAAKEMAREGNYVLRRDADLYKAYTILDAEDDYEVQSIYCYAEDAGLDLINELVGPYEAAEAHPAAYYIERFAYDSGFEIGLNEISNLSRQLKWEGTATATERIRSVATQFDNAEIGYSFAVSRMQVTHRYIDIYKRRGKDIAQELRTGREIGKIVRKTSIANLATGLQVTGGTPEADPEGGQPQPVTLAGYEYDDGDIYVTPGGLLLSREANKTWSRYLEKGQDTDQGYIMKPYSYDTLSQETLFAHAVTELKKVREPEVNYDVSLLYLPENLVLGDTVRIVDDRNELYLSARLLRLEISESSDTRSAVFGDYLIKGSGISERLTKLAEEVAAMPKSRTTYTWIVYADDSSGTGITTDSEGKVYVGIAANRLTPVPDLSDPTVYKWTRIEGIDGNDGYMLSVTNAWNAARTIVTMTAHVYQGETEVTGSMKPGQFEWFLRTEDGDTSIGQGKTVTVSAESLGYGGTIVCRWTSYVAKLIVDRAGRHVLARDGSAIIARAS